MGGHALRILVLTDRDWTHPQGGGTGTHLWEQITRTAGPKARVIFRTAGPDSPLERKLPAELIGRWNYMAEEAQRFHDQDRSSIYGGFHIYELKGN